MVIQHLRPGFFGKWQKAFSFSYFFREPINYATVKHLAPAKEFGICNLACPLKLAYCTTVFCAFSVSTFLPLLRVFGLFTACLFSVYFNGSCLFCFWQKKAKIHLKPATKKFSLIIFLMSDKFAIMMPTLGLKIALLFFLQFSIQVRKFYKIKRL